MKNNSAFLDVLRNIVGRRHVLVGKKKTAGYAKGFRYGGGDALAVVRPGSLLEQWRVVKACASANKIIIMQAANTGLTGGSTPYGEYDRDVVLVNTMRMPDIQLIDNGRQVICFPGSQLNRLEKKLNENGREPHSVIGSSCIGASVIGGVCNNSGGSLVRRGPAFTRHALYAQIDENGVPKLVNHLGVELGQSPEDCLRRLERGEYDTLGFIDDVDVGSDYEARVRDVNADSPARFNADPTRLFEASGSAGRLVLFAVRLPTYPKVKKTGVFYLGTTDTKRFRQIRSDILTKFESLPISGEYLHGDSFDIAQRYGKDTILAMKWLGVEKLPILFSIKNLIDSVAQSLGMEKLSLSDRILQAGSRLFPKQTPKRILEFRARFDHHLMIKMDEAGREELKNYLSSLKPSHHFDYLECTEKEAEQAFLLRYAAAGAAVRYRNIHSKEVEDIVALDIAIRRNDEAWFIPLEPDLEPDVKAALYYGHFFCHVSHQDYILRRGRHARSFKDTLLSRFDKRGVKYPAEHNVGHVYKAEPNLVEFYKELDPSNSLNPGIGQTSKVANWK